MSKPYSTRVLEYLENWREVASQVKEIVKGFDQKAEVYVFGSVVNGRYTAASDIDILVVTKRIDRKYDIMVEVYRRIEAPIELHVVTPQQFIKWYRRFISENQIVRV